MQIRPGLAIVQRQMPRKTRKLHLSVLALNMRALRSRLGWTQADLARVSGISHGTIAAIETDRFRSADTSTIITLARAFNVAPTELLGAHADDAGDTIVNDFLDSSWAKVIVPTPDEIAWLRSMPKITWVSETPRPAPEAVVQLILWRRNNVTRG